MREGEVVWQVVEEKDETRVGLFSAVYLGRNASWRSFKNVATGEVWKENGMAWHPTAEAALRHYLLTNTPGGPTQRMLDALFNWCPEKRWRRYLHAAAMLHKLLASKEQL